MSKTGTELIRRMNEEREGMKPCFISATIRDGLHEHGTYALLLAESHEQAQEEALKHEYEPEGDTDEAVFGFGDGMTAARIDRVEEITQAEAKTLRRLCIAEFIN